MNILMLSNTYTPIVGGVERSIKNFAGQYRSRGHNVLIVTLEFDNMPRKEDDVIRLPAIRRFNGSDFSVRLPIPTSLAARLHKFKPDIVHAHHPFMLGDTALRIADEYRIPLVFTHHTKYEDYTHYVPIDFPIFKKFVVELTTGYAELADYVIAPSASVEHLLIERGVKTPIAVIPTGVDLPLFSSGDRDVFRLAQGIAENDFVIGHVGRLAPEKNLGFLIPAVVRFLKKTPNAKFLLVGKGPAQKEIQYVFTQNKLDDRLITAGVLQHQDLADAYAAMDVFAFSSKTETQGMVLLEAMAAGVPVVALSASGVDDIVADGKNGWLVTRERIPLFVQALQEAYNADAAARTARAEEARRTAAGLSMETVAEKMLTIYKELIEEEKQYSNIDESLWARAVGRLHAEWELVSNFAEAVTSLFREEFFKPPWERFFLRLGRWLNPYEWSIRLLGLTVSEHTAARPGLVLIQIDGFGLAQVHRALKDGRMPFMQHLLKKERYSLRPLYTGQPSSTPAVQAELFYGARTAVPSFSFRDPEQHVIFKMYDSESAVAVETRLMQTHVGLLEGGSSYANVYRGGARESHFCAVDLGWDAVWRKISVRKLVVLSVVNLFLIAQTVGRMAIELVLGTVDFLLGAVSGKNIFKELKFIPTRLSLCILLRDFITFGVKVDTIRGLPVIHCNFVGYDEHAHRRGPDSRFAHWTVRGIDAAVRRIYKTAMHSRRRSYDIWLYSDHGHEHMISYAATYKEIVHKAVARVVRDLFGPERAALITADGHGIQSVRMQYLGGIFLRWLQPLFKRNAHHARADSVVTAMGPVGHVYIPWTITAEDRDTLARRLMETAHIPLVLCPGDGTAVTAWYGGQRFSLPQDAAALFGNEYPFLPELVTDLMAVCRHPCAGALTICGWRREGLSFTFPMENGAHGGPGKEEIQGFSMLPADIISVKDKPHVRPADIRQAALHFLNRGEDGFVEKRVPVLTPADGRRTIRVMTYNVHGCRGMDGKISPERIARVISRADPDIVALQELDMNRYRSGNIDQPHAIANSLAMQFHFHASIDVEEGQYGNAILSKYPMQVIAAAELPGSEHAVGNEPRGALWAAVNIDGTILNIINTHLGLRRKERLQQIRTLLGNRLLRHEKCTEPAILVGDFNALPRSREVQELCRYLKDAQKELDNHRPRATWFGFMPVRRIDHIFISNGISVENIIVPKGRIDRIASDHLPLIADVTVG